MSEQETNDESLERLIDDLEKRHSDLRWLWLLVLIPVGVGIFFIFWSTRTVATATQLKKDAKKSERQLDRAERKILKVANSTRFGGDGADDIIDLDQAIMKIQQQLSDDSTSEYSTASNGNCQQRLDSLENVIEQLQESVSGVTNDMIEDGDVEN